MPPNDWAPDPESLQILGAEIAAALARYHQSREGYLMEVRGPGGGRGAVRRIPRNVNLGPGRANPYVGTPPPLWAALPKRHPYEPPSDWIKRCGIAAVEAALSVLATEYGWRITALPGPTEGWRVIIPGKGERVDIHTGNIISPVPWEAKGQTP